MVESQRVLVTGASGLVGRRTVAALAAQGHHVHAASRNPQAKWPEGITPVHYTPGTPLPAGMDAIINLAGASIGGKRWNKRYKQELIESRVQVTRDAIAAKPGRLIQASAIGYYGINPEGDCSETRAPGDDFLAQLCVQWEREARTFAGPLAVFRFGHIFDNNKEGILGRLVPLYRLRLGGRIASGKQGLPWVHADDVARALAWAVESGTEGTFNLAAPQQVSQGELNQGLAKALGVCAIWWIPGVAMRVAVGGLGPYLVGGQTTPPTNLLDAGFQFEHPNLDGALNDLFGKQTV